MSGRSEYTLDVSETDFELDYDLCFRWAKHLVRLLEWGRRNQMRHPIHDICEAFLLLLRWTGELLSRQFLFDFRTTEVINDPMWTIARSKCEGLEKEIGDTLDKIYGVNEVPRFAGQNERGPTCS